MRMLFVCCLLVILSGCNKDCCKDKPQEKSYEVKIESEDDQFIDPVDTVEDKAYAEAAKKAHAGVCTWPYREETPRK